MSLIKPKAPRWYREQNGVVEACYTMPKKDGSGMKDTTLREARELGLLPSVTSILRVMAQPGLERWKLEQVIHSAMTLPRLPGETEDAFARRIVDDSEAQAAKAAEFGTRIHDAIASIIDYKVKPFVNDIVDATLWPFLEPFTQWANDNIEEIHAVEKVVGGKHCGYAGRLDLDCTLKGVGGTLVDFKTTAVREGKSPVFYEDSWLPQLCAYRDASTDSIPRIMSLVIDSRTPGPVWPKLWGPEEMVRGTKIFVYCLELWKALNDYDPTKPVFDPIAAVNQDREERALKQMGILPMKELDS